MDFPYYVERVVHVGSSHLTEWIVVRRGRDILCSTPDVNAAYKIIDLLNAEHEREKKGLGANRAPSFNPSAAPGVTAESAAGSEPAGPAG